MINQDIYVKDPLANPLLNEGVAEVTEDRSESAMVTLRYELETFVCDGEYEKGLRKILETYLSKLGQAPEQPSVWVSGFYGSGKTHLTKMLRAFWVNEPMPDGATPRGLADLPTDIQDLLRELSTHAKQYGGLHAASGKLGSGAGGNARLALLGIVFKSAGLPEKYNQARLVMWLKREGILDSVQQSLAQSGTDLATELPDLFVSDELHAAIHAAKPGRAPDASTVGDRLIAQYPEVQDVSNDEMIRAIKEALSRDGKFPLTLIILDEVQQFIGQSGDRAYSIQEVVESCAKHFGGRLLFIGTGQTAMSGTASLQKIKGRFTVPVQLSDTDVEDVIRKIILQKKQRAVPEIQRLLTDHLGEISRHLRGTKLEHTTEDEALMVADYPLLPVRRRFWEKVLHRLDESGNTSQLRSQLRIAHEAASATAMQPLGGIVSGDFIYDQLSADLLQNGLLSREVDDRIRRLANGTDEDLLKASLMKLIYLIGKLPTEPAADIGLRATEDSLADLLVSDLDGDSSALRKAVPQALEALLNQDRLVMAIAGASGTEYRLQTAESSAWNDEFLKNRSTLSANTTRLDMKRIDALKTACQEALKRVHLTQGQGQVVRTVTACFDDSLPNDAAKRIYAWFRDGWSSSDAEVVGDARNAGPNSPSIFVFLPAQSRNELRSALIEHGAAQSTLDTRGVPGTTEGQDARSAMETRRNDAAKRIAAIIKEVIAGACVYQAGGQAIDGKDLTEKLQHAGAASVVRLYRDFDIADQAGWDKALDRARKGETQPLQVMGHTSETDQHPVTSTLLKHLGAGKQGSEVREHFMGPSYGWSQDAVDGALYALLASGHVRAKNNQGKSVDAKGLERRQLTQCQFVPETVTVSPVQKIQIRKLFQAADVGCQPGQELDKAPALLQRLRDLADQAGGEAPKPERPDGQLLDALEALSGNSLLAELFSQRAALMAHIEDWQATAEAIAQHWPDWLQLQYLLDHAKALGPWQTLQAEAEEIRQQRALLAAHDPVQALLGNSLDLLRTSLNSHVERYAETLTQEEQSLAEDDNWQQLDDAQQAEILRNQGLVAAPAVNVATAEDILDALEQCSLSQWSDREQALTGRFEQARLEAARLLQPKVQRVDLPRRTLDDEQALADWLAEAETRIRAKLKDGPVVI
ncbi:BREX system P-loop protein BrxC [uncultured Thiohalocapsa sp.]|mgnify:FL=1|uniref:BREX system P-loop protein BrxC n=1 Tax=uncultured Thiohalocapsa sp. TaxID=768990 RepID=UPI0025D8D128|nr:BREX system P-loop protein BrxC [uncultured Thiohalocapsa sp.]